MAGRDEIDVPRLVDVAESGRGCSVQKILNELTFEDRAGVMKEIADRNSLRRELQKTTTRLISVDNKDMAGEADRHVSLSIASGRIVSQSTMLKDIQKDGFHIIDCTDVKLRD
jgi:hypothetical protein